MSAEDLNKPAELTIFGLEPLVEVGPVAEFLGVSKARVYQMVRDGLLDAVEMGRRKKFSPEIIREWVRNNGSSYPGGWRKEAV